RIVDGIVETRSRQDVTRDRIANEMPGAVGIHPHAQRIVNLVPPRIDTKQLRKIAVAIGQRGNRSINVIGLLRPDVLEAVVAEKEEEPVTSIHYFRNHDRAANRARIVVLVAGGLLILAAKLVSERRIALRLGRRDVAVIELLHEEGSPVPTLLPVLFRD